MHAQAPRCALGQEERNQGKDRRQYERRAREVARRLETSSIITTMTSACPQ